MQPATSPRMATAFSSAWTASPDFILESMEYPTAEARFLSVEEVNRLAAELTAQPPYDLLVRFGALTGLRIGEVAALRIRDIDPAVARCRCAAT